MITDVVNETAIAFASYVWRVTLAARGVSLTKEILVMTEDSVPGTDFNAIVKLHAREFAREYVIPNDSIMMKETVLLGRAYGATKTTDRIVEPEMERDPSGEIRLSEGLIRRVQEFTDRLENGGVVHDEAHDTDEARSQFRKWEAMAFDDSPHKRYSSRHENRAEKVANAAADVVSVVLPNGEVANITRSDLVTAVLNNKSHVQFCRVCNKNVEVTDAYVEAHKDECPECHVTCLKPTETPPEGEQG